jgi:hypothetical protein
MKMNICTSISTFCTHTSVGIVIAFGTTGDRLCDCPQRILRRKGGEERNEGRKEGEGRNLKKGGRKEGEERRKEGKGGKEGRKEG